MKLVEILAREMEKWPDDLAHDVWQADGGTLHMQQKDKTICFGWTDKAYTKADDWFSAIVTRADWEALREKLKAPKANGGGWVRHRGGKCPVDDVVIEYRERCGNISIEQKPQYLDTMWLHDGGPHDIMAYRIHKPAEQPSSITREDIAEAVKLARFKPDSSAPADTMLAIRDRIRELDTQRVEVEATYQRQISEITQERESLVQRLAGEGLALVGVVVQSVEDISDPVNWRKGDLITFVSSRKGSGFTIGKQYVFEELDEDGSACVLVDDEGDENGWCVEYFKWHSRPSS